MSFLTDEIGKDTGKPIELYRFVGTLATYSYTSSTRPIQVGAETFRPIPIRRSAIILGDVTEKNELKINLPKSAPLVRDYGFNIPPPDLRVQIFRMHGPTGEIQPWFTGTVTSLVVQGVTCDLVVPSVFSAYMSTEFPSVFFQSQCNHVLYSVRCGASQDGKVFSTSVGAIVDTTHLIVDLGIDFEAGFFTGGEVTTEVERRLIVKHDGVNIWLNYPFREIDAGQDVTLYAGCDHKINTCHTKFNNLVNFLGWPYTPSLNPFTQGLK